MEKNMIGHIGKETSEDLLYSLEAVMVSIFRSMQLLNSLTQEERQALVRADIIAITEIVDKKEVALDELYALNETQQTLTRKLVQLNHLEDRVSNLGELLNHLNDPTAERVKRILEGTNVMQAKLKDLNQANQAIASVNLDRINAIRSFLSDLFKPIVYSPYGHSLKNIQLPAISGMSHRV